MINFEKKKLKNNIEFTIIGEGIIDNAAVIKTQLQEIINEKNLILNLNKIENIDTSFIQLLASFIETLKKNKKPINFKINPQNIIINKFKDFGFHQHKKFNELFQNIMELNHEK